MPKMYKKLILPFIASGLVNSCDNSTSNPKNGSGGGGGGSEPKLALISTYRTGVFDESASEIIAFHPKTKRVFSVNANAATVDIIDLSDVKNPKKWKSVELGGGGATCVAARDEFIVASVAGEGTGPGEVVFLNPNGDILNRLKVGSLPDNVTVSKDSKIVMTANEGEPNDDYTDDPEGSVSLIEISGKIEDLDESAVTTIGFADLKKEDLDESTRIFGPKASIAQDLEPEYVRITPDGTKAYVVCQENNAVAIIDVPGKKLIGVKGLGFADHSKEGHGFDASDKSKKIDIKPQPTKGMYQPDAFTINEIGGKTYLLLANEGDSRDYDGWSEEVRVEDLALDPEKFPNAEELKKEENLGRLKTTNTLGDTDGDGDVDEIYSYGTRSFSIRDEDLNIVFDSGDGLARNALKALEGRPDTKDPEFFKDRSDDKGVEPEAIAVGRLGEKTYALIGLERLGGLAVYDVSDPKNAKFLSYSVNRDYSADEESEEAGDIGPECVLFIPADESPSGEALVIVSNEVSGSISFFSFK